MTGFGAGLALELEGLLDGLDVGFATGFGAELVEGLLGALLGAVAVTFVFELVVGFDDGFVFGFEEGFAVELPATLGGADGDFDRSALDDPIEFGDFEELAGMLDPTDLLPGDLSLLAVLEFGFALPETLGGVLGFLELLATVFGFFEFDPTRLLFG